MTLLLRDAPSASGAAAVPIASNSDTAVGPDWFQRGLLVALLLALAMALSANTVDPDLWGHVRYAQDTLATGHLARTATHTYTAVGHRWINHETLSELALTLGYAAVGARGLLVIKCLLGLGLVTIVLRRARRCGMELPAAGAFALLVAMTLAAFWALRPQVASFLLLAAMVAVLDRAFARWQTERKIDGGWLWILPPLFAVWVNAHGGFVAGLALLAAYLGCRSLEAMWLLGRRAWALVARLALVGVVAALATTANPYGLQLLRWIAGSLAAPRPEITEWLPPAPSDAFFIPFVLLVSVALAAWAATDRRRDWTHAALILLCMWQALLHSRNIPLFTILVAFWTPPHLQAVLARLRRGRAAAPAKTDSSLPPGRSRRLLTAALAAALGLLVVRLTGRMSELPVERGAYPVDALQFMAEHKLHGKLVVTFDWAQYAMAALAPNVRVQFDGRFRTCYPQQAIDMQFDFLLGDLPGRRWRSPESGPIDGRRILEYRQPDLVLVDRRYTHATRIMEQQRAFVLLYQDGLAQVWGRRSRYDNPTSPNYLASSQRRIGSTLPQGSVPWPAFPDLNTNRST